MKVSKLARALQGEPTGPDLSTAALEARAIAAAEAGAGGGDVGGAAAVVPPSAEGSVGEDGAAGTGVDDGVAADGVGAAAGDASTDLGGDGAGAGGERPAAVVAVAGVDGPVKQLDDGTWVVDGKFKGASLEEAVAAQTAANKEVERVLTQQAQELTQLRQERDLAAQNAQAAQQVPQSAPASVVQHMQAEQQLRAIAQENPQRAAELALEYAIENNDESLAVYRAVVGDWMEMDSRAAWQYDSQVRDAVAEAKAQQAAGRATQLYAEQTNAAQSQAQAAATHDDTMSRGLEAFAREKPDVVTRQQELMDVLRENPQLLHVDPSVENYQRAFALAYRVMGPDPAATAAAQASQAASQAAARNTAHAQTGADGLGDLVGDDGSGLSDSEKDYADSIRNGILSANKRKTPFWATANE